MKTAMTWMLTTAVALAAPTAVETPTPLPEPRPIPVSLKSSLNVPCDRPGALPRALEAAQRLPEVEIWLDGICTGNFAISTGRVTLRGVTPDSGLAAPSGAPSGSPVLEVAGARVNLFGLVVRGGDIGVLADGHDSVVLLGNVEVTGQAGFGVLADRGADLNLVDATVTDAGAVGILVRGNSTANVQRSTLSGHRIGVDVSERSFLALTDTTLENNIEGGLSVSGRSDANVGGVTFLENGQVHMSSRDWSSINLFWDPTIGTPTDSTRLAMSATRYATISSFGPPDIYGDASALIGASLQLGNTVLHGDLTAIQFADAFVRNAEITGSVACLDGADVICRQTTTAGSFGCASTTCGPATAKAVEHGATAADD